MKLALEKIKSIMKSYYLNKIEDNDELRRLYKDFFTKDDIIKALHIAVEEKDSQGVEDIFHISFALNLLPSKEESIFQILLLERWHNRHEDVVRLCQNVYHNNKENAKTLLNAIETIPEYLQDEDFKYPYIRKIIYAIGAQPEPDNIKALEDLAKSKDEKIRDLATHQIEKRKKLGRWEAAKNDQ